MILLTSTLAVDLQRNLDDGFSFNDMVPGRNRGVVDYDGVIPHSK